MKSTLIILFCCLSYAVFGQITLNPPSDLQNLSYLNITKVEITDKNTIISMRYVCPYNDSSWICANKEFYINGVYQLDRKKLLKTMNIPICDGKYWLTKRGSVRDFQLFFQKLEAGVEKINIVEGYGPNQFNFYGVVINNPAPKETPTKEPTIAQNNTNNNRNNNQNNNNRNNNQNNNNRNNNQNNNNRNNNQNTKPPQETVKVEPEKPKLNFGTQKVGLKDSVNVRILFDKASDVIKQESLPELQKLITFMKTNPTVVIELTGHTEADEPNYNSKQRASNLQLSIGRINTVKEFLVVKGIPSHRVYTKAYGGARPISTDPSVNRRVVMRILKY
jgi:outer membrane protein OmpA-like peptidoglycan-associated protein